MSSVAFKFLHRWMHTERIRGQLLDDETSAVLGSAPRTTSRTLEHDEVKLLRSSKRRTPLVSKLLNPLVFDLLETFPLKRRFWAAHGADDQEGFWELEVLGTWARLGREHPDWENERYVSCYRMEKYVFNQLALRYGEFFQKEDTPCRNAIPLKKRLAITLHWLRQGGSYKAVADQYRVGYATVHCIVHEVVEVLCNRLVPEVVKFPTQPELDRVIDDFESLLNLPQCCGAVDGTFMKIQKPVRFGDSYYCYKGYPALLLLGCVDARGIFTNVNVGNPGSVGDAYVFNNSHLKARLSSRRWGREPIIIDGQLVGSYVIGDSAFALSSILMKCYEEENLLPRQRSFNYCVIRTRRVVEQAFGRLKGRWNVLVNNFLKDPTFAAKVALVCAALHNVCERASCPFEDSWIPAEGNADDGQPPPANPELQALMMRDAISRHVHGLMLKTQKVPSEVSLIQPLKQLRHESHVLL